MARSLALFFLLWGASETSLAKSTESLAIGSPRQGDLKPKEVHPYSVAVAANQYIWIQASSQGVDIQLVLRGPRGSVVQRVDDRSPQGLENVYWITESSGEHRLEVHSVRETSGTYELRWKASEPATEERRLRAPAERAYTRALGLKNRIGSSHWHQAIHLFAETLPIWQQVDDPVAAASTLDNLGACHSQLEEYPAAASFYRRAIERWPTPRYLTSKANSVHNLAVAQIELGQYRDGIASYRTALGLFRDNGKELRAAKTQRALGDAYKTSGRLADAERELLEALTIFGRYEDVHGRLQALNTLGSVYSHMGRVEEAMDRLQQARELTGHDDRLGIKASAAIVSNLASIHNWTGEPMRALSGFLEALDLNRRIENRTGEAFVLRQLGLLYRDLSEHDDALDYLWQSARLRDQLGKSAGGAEVQVLIGDVLRRAGRPGEALQTFEAAVPILKSRGNAVQLVIAFEKQGLTLAELGRDTEALAVFHQALELLDKIEEPGRQARLLTALGASEIAVGSLAKSARTLGQALDLSRASGDLATEIEAQTLLARLERRRDRLATAQRHAETALAAVESTRDRVGGERFRSTYLSQQLRVFETTIEVLLARHAQQPAGGFDRAAFNVSERMRARALHDLLGASRAELLAGVPPELLARERDLRRRLNAHDSFLNSAGQRLAEEKRAELDAKLAKLLREYRQVKASIFDQSPRFSRLARRQTLSLEAVQRQILDKDTALIEIFLGQEKSSMWVVTQSAYRWVELPARSELEGIAQDLLSFLTLPARRPAQATPDERRRWQQRLNESERRYVEQGERLASLLFEPAADLLGDRRLLVVADGALSALPFAALPEPGSRFPVWDPLIAKREIVQAPSASVLAAIREWSRKREAPEGLLAVFADPTFRPDNQQAARLRSAGRQLDLRPLPHTRSEALAILTLATPRGPVLSALGVDASIEKVLSPEVARYRYLHFATHGIIDDRRPELSGILLSMVDSEGRDREGLLHLHDIYHLSLAAELVVLSACETALGREIRGEGLLSLTRGFMFAGAPRILASFWKVEDRSTGELMKHFYDGLLNRGLRPVAALREAVLSVRSKALGEQRHPFYWSGFGLFGEWL